MQRNVGWDLAIDMSCRSQDGVDVGKDGLVPQLPPTEHHTIVVVDVANFTSAERILADQATVREGLYDVMRTAFDETGVRFADCVSEDRGDGALVLLPPDVSKSKFVDLLPDRLVVALRRHNWNRAAAAQFKLRISIHSGDIRNDGKGWVGEAVNLAFRILETSEVKKALAESDAVAALIASSHFYSEVIRQDPGTAPESYEHIRTSVKTFQGDVWFRLLGGVGLPIVVPIGPQPPAAPAVGIASPVPARAMPSTGGVLDVAPDDELEALRRLLDAVDVARLPMIAARAAGPAIPPPPNGSAWEVFRYLSDWNADDGGVSPAFVFLDMLAGYVGVEHQAAILGWVDQQARRLRLGSALRERRAGQLPIPEAPRLHLMIMLEPDAIDGNRCVLSYWRQDDPDMWPPNRGDVGEVAVDQLEHRVDEIILDAERMWAGQAASVLVEFVLARSMLKLPVMRWRKEHESGDPRLLTLDYRVGIRSLERMRNSHWHRAWRVRWASMVKVSGIDRIYPFGSVMPDEQPIDIVLSDPRWGGLVLAQPPAAQAESGVAPDALNSALRAGLPLICWHPSAGPEDLREPLDWLLSADEGFVDLLGRRKAAHSAPPEAIDLVHDLVVMWDDPNRVIVLDQPSIPTR